MKLNNLKEPYVIILIGPPLSGKTTFINNNFSNNKFTLISRDEILMDVAGTNNYSQAFLNVDQREVNRLLDKKLLEASANKENVIVDMTNLRSKRRRTTLDYFDNSYLKIALIFPDISTDEYKMRNEKRQKEENKFIPENLMRNMINSFQPIVSSEGFNRVISI